MPTVALYNMEGAKVGDMQLSDAIFGQEVNKNVLHQVVVNYLANQRQGTQSTKTRTEVRGGGIKPWRQKGTGRARQGSIRAPQWIKGGVVFAPKPRDFSQKVNKQAKRNALVSALSAKVADGDFIALDKFAIEPKTKQMASILKALNLDKRVLVITAENDEIVMRASGNIKSVKVLPAGQINVYDLVANSKCLMTVDAIKKIEEAYKA